ncbi:MAG: MFS transporter, partial [Candidatus Lokiarchaeota archaeon]|nr:MFS transporter [Candidatus Lokiarchaeota archaeon]
SMLPPPDTTPTRRVHLFTLMVASIGNAVVWGMNSILQFHAGLRSWEGGFGLSALDVGIIFGVASVFGAFSNVFWGALSDKTNSKYGKRKPFMFIFPPLVMVTLWMASKVDVLFGMQVVFGMLLLMVTVKGVLHNGANVPYSTVIPEVVPPEKRVAVSQLSAIVQGIGFAAGAVVPAILFDVFDDFGIPFIFAGAIMVAFYLISSTAVPSDAKPVKTEKIFRSMKVALRNRNFMVFEAAQFLWTLGLNIVIFVIPFLAHDILGIFEEDVFAWFFVSFLLIAGALLLGLNYVIQKRRVEKKKALLIMLLFSASALPFVGFVGTPAFSFMPILVQVYLFGSILFGGLVGIFIFPYAIMMGLIDYSSGSEGAYNGTNGTILGLAAIPAGPIGGLLITLGYPCVGIVGAVLFLASAVVILRVQVPEHLFEKGGGSAGVARAVDSRVQ